MTTNLKVYMTLPIASCEDEGNFSKLSIINNEFLRNMLWLKKMILQNEQAIKEYADKKCRKNVLYRFVGS